LRPDHGEARSTIAAILDRQRGAHGAAALDGISYRRAADMAAARIRWGAEVRAEDPARRFDGTDRALADLDALLARLRADPAADPALVRRVRIDRIVALRDRVRMAEVITEAEALAPLPAFAEEAYADALLHVRRPLDALAAYDRVLAANPQSIEAAYGRVFALVEAERLAPAITAADAILASRPRFVSFRGGPARTPDSEYVYAAQLAAQVRLWANRVADGHDRITALADAAPASFAFREARSGAYSARGWPRAAKAEAEIAASLNPGSIASELLLTDTALARNELDTAQDRSTQLLALAPENLAVQRLDQEVRAQRGWLVEANLEPNFTNGGGSFAVGEGYGADISVQTPRLFGPWRLVSRFVSAVAEPPEGRVSRQQLGAGLMFDGRNVAATIYGGRSWGSLPQTSASIDVSWQLDDHWRLSGTGELNSIETPIRALVAGIRADAMRGGISWRRDERLEISGSLQWLGLSDGNDRLGGGVSLVSMLHTTPHFTLRGRIDATASRNSRPGGPYFAPEQDGSLSAGLAAEHVSWRRYQRSFTQVTTVDAGVYAQRNFDAGWIGVVRYEHRWRQDPWTEIFYGIGLARRVFDGVGQREFSLSVGVTQRFG
jgi:biofilm PGA synthesis protein PgaA